MVISKPKRISIAWGWVHINIFLI